jgi:hypothetical protein
MRPGLPTAARSPASPNTAGVEHPQLHDYWPVCHDPSWCLSGWARPPCRRQPARALPRRDRVGDLANAGVVIQVFSVATRFAPWSNHGVMPLSGTSVAWRPEDREKTWGACLLCAAAAFLPALPAMASQDARAREARTACLAGDYNKGVTILSELFVNTRDPTYIYNQGRCFEQNARFREGISRFQEYLRVAKDAPAEARAEAEKHIADCRELLAQELAAPAINPAPPVLEREAAPPSPAIQLSTPSRSGIASEGKPGSPEPARGAGSGLRAAGIVTASVGGAALVAGVLLNLKVNDISSGYQAYNGYTDQKESQRKSYETWGWVSYGAGAVCVATGAVLYYLGLRANTDGSPSVAIAPARGGAALIVRGTL